MLAVMLTALVSTYVSAWVEAATARGSRLDRRYRRDDLHALVDHAFVA